MNDNIISDHIKRLPLYFENDFFDQFNRFSNCIKPDLGYQETIPKFEGSKTWINKIDLFPLDK